MQNRLMRLRGLLPLSMGFVCGICCLSELGSQTHLLIAEEKQTPTEQVNSQPATVAEARARATILHETIHGVLQVMHRDFFDAEESLSIPSHSLEDVFKELEARFGVSIRWLAVNAKAMNVDNKPASEFEYHAVKALAEGNEYFEEAAQESYRYVGTIRLSSQCLRCHLPARRNNDPRVAGLAISMTMKKQKP